MKIQVLDALCGAGKTTEIFRVMREDFQDNTKEKKKWIFCSPYLDEAGDGTEKGRIQRDLPEMGFISPSPTPSKQKSFRNLVERGDNIAITHSLFSMLTLDTAKLLKERNYHLVIDETIDLISYYGGMSGHDVKILLNQGMMYVGKNNRLI